MDDQARVNDSCMGLDSAVRLKHGEIQARRDPPDARRIDALEQAHRDWTFARIFPDDIATANEWDHRPFPDLLTIRLLSFKPREIWCQLRRPLARQRQEFVPYRVGVPLDLGYAGKICGFKIFGGFYARDKELRRDV